MDKRFAILLEALDHHVLVEKGKDAKTIEVSLRHGGEHYRGEVFGYKPHQYLEASLRQNGLARQLLENHVARWVSDTLERISHIRERAPALPACILCLGGKQVVVEPSYHIDINNGRTQPCLTARAMNWKGEKKRLIHTFQETEKGYLARDEMFANLAQRHGIPTAVHALLESIRTHIHGTSHGVEVRFAPAIERCPCQKQGLAQAPCRNVNCDY